MKATTEIKSAIAAAAADDCGVMRKMLRENPELAEEPRLLSLAALYGLPEMIRTLLTAGADPDAQVASHEYYRPLHRAIEHRGVPGNAGHREAVEILLDADASLEKRSTWMQLVPLAVAAMTGNREIISLLINRGAEVNLFTAAILADAGKVRSFLRKSKIAASRKDVNNMTVLHYTALSGLSGPEAETSQRQIAEMLLDAGADGNAREPIGPYPPTPVLHFAAWKNYTVAEVLLKRGCNPNYGFGNCLWRDPGPMAELFLAHGADVNGRESSGQPILNSRIHWNLPGVALWLLKNGANPNQTDAAGNTALHEAAIRGINLKVVQAILNSGGEKSARNNEGKAALDIAKMKNREKIAHFLAAPSLADKDSKKSV